jgi:hypothetical protein
MATLKKMILSWLEDYHPDMPASEQLQLAEAMDISLIERKKEESLRAPFYELNNVIRMSFIEMQYMKKVRIVCNVTKLVTCTMFVFELF